MKTILATGQSNSVGYYAEGRTDWGSGLTLWNAENNSTSPSVNLGTAFVAPNKAAFPFTAGANSPVVWFASHVARYMGEDVRVIWVSRNGQSILGWSNASGVKSFMYTRMLAVLAAAGVSSIDAMFWHQGESDDATNDNNVGIYAACFGHILSGLESGGFITSSTPVVIGNVVSNLESMNGVLDGIAAASSRVGIAKIAGQPRWVSGSSHFQGEAYYDIGNEYARALSALPCAFNGMVPAPADKPCFKAVKQKVQTGITSGLPVNKVTFPVALYNVGGCYDVTTSRFTPSAGVYRFSARMEIGGVNTGSANQLWLRKNGKIIARAFLSAEGSGNEMRIDATDWADGNSYYEIELFATVTGSPAIDAMDHMTWFSAEAI